MVKRGEYFLKNLDIIYETITTSYGIGDMEKFRIYASFLSGGYDLGLYLSVEPINFYEESNEELYTQTYKHLI